jgi:hypothetical protein
VLEALKERRSTSSKSSLEAGYFVGHQALKVPETKKLRSISFDARPRNGRGEIIEESGQL